MFRFEYISEHHHYTIFCLNIQEKKRKNEKIDKKEGNWIMCNITKKSKGI